MPPLAGASYCLLGQNTACSSTVVVLCGLLLCGLLAVLLLAIDIVLFVPLAVAAEAESG